MAANYTTLDKVVRGLIIEQGKNSENEYQRFAQLGIFGLKELSFDTLRQIKTKKITVKSNGSVDLPDDYVTYLKIGKHGNDDRVHWLALDSKRYLGTDSKSNTSSGETDDYAYVFRNYLLNGERGQMYGLGGGNNANGYYREDKDNNTILFSSGNVGDEIVLEYISDGITGLSSDQIRVHVFSEEALRSFIHWKSIQRKRNIPQYEKEGARRDYYNEKRLARARMSKFTKEEALTYSRKAFKLSPKM